VHTAPKHPFPDLGQLLEESALTYDCSVNSPNYEHLTELAVDILSFPSKITYTSVACENDFPVTSSCSKQIGLGDKSVLAEKQIPGFDTFTSFL
jgi:hypothetical protein